MLGRDRVLRVYKDKADLHLDKHEVGAPCLHYAHYRPTMHHAPCTKPTMPHAPCTMPTWLHAHVHVR